MKTYVITSAIIRRNDQYLIVRRAPNQKFAPGKWEFVSGFMEQDESSEETILREVQEEVGGEGRIIQPLPIYVSVDSEGRWVVVPFIVKLSGGGVQLSDEHTEYRWVGREELNEIPEMTDDVQHLNGSL